MVRKTMWMAAVVLALASFNSAVAAPRDFGHGPDRGRVERREPARRFDRGYRGGPVHRGDERRGFRR